MPKTVREQLQGLLKPISSVQLAKILGVRAGTVRQWRVRKIGPRPLRLPGGGWRYEPAVILAWYDREQGRREQREREADAKDRAELDAMRKRQLQRSQQEQR